MKYDNYDRLIKKYSNYILYTHFIESLTIKGDYLELVEYLNGKINIHLIHKRNIHSISLFDTGEDGATLLKINFTLNASKYKNGINLKYTDDVFRDITEWMSL